MDAVVFVVIVAAVGIVGVVLGLAVAPRLTAWDERQERPAEPDPGPAGYHGVGPEAGREGPDGEGPDGDGPDGEGPDGDGAQDDGGGGD